MQACALYGSLVFWWKRMAKELNKISHMMSAAVC